MKRIVFSLLTIIVLAMMMLPAGQPVTAGSGPSLWTDKLDYAPGEVVTISGSSFLANTPVTVTVERPDGTKDTISPAPVTDDAGNFNCTYQLNGIAGTYTVTATDGTNTATTTFTDLPKVVSVSVAPASRSVNQGTPATYTVTVTRGPGADSFDATLSIINAAPSIPGTSITFTPQLILFPDHQPYISLTSTLTITTGSLSPGTYTFNVKAERTVDNDYAISSQVTLTVIDTTPPTVTIDQAVGQADPTNTSPINFTVVFSEAVADFTTGDVTLSGTAGATTATVTGSGTTYNVAVSGMTSDGTVIASVAAGVAHDAADNANTASTSTDNTVTYDITPPPAPTLLSPAGDSLTNDNTVDLDWSDVSDPSTPVQYQVQVDNNNDFSSPEYDSGWISASDATTPALGDDTYNWRARAKDGAGNVGPWSGVWQFTVDTTPPVGLITINGDAAYTNTVSVTLNLAATDAVGVTGYRVADGTDASGASTVAVSSTTSFSADIPWTLPSGDGTKTVAVQYRDVAGNWSQNYTDSIILDTTPPNSPPVLASIGDKTVNEQTLLTFTATATDPDIPAQTLSFSLSGAPAGASITSAGDFSWTPTEAQGPNAYTFDVVVSDGSLTDSETITITVNEVNVAPVVNDIPDQTIAEGDTFATINLDDYVSDVDNADADMTWTYSGNIELTVTIVDRVATITIPDENWNGAETITFTATDPGALSDSDDATFTVTPAQQPSVGGGGGGGGARLREYFTVDFLGEITKEPISSTGRLLNSLEAPSLDGIHVLEMEEDTRTLGKDGEVIKLIEITEAEPPRLPENTVIVGKVYDFEPSNITFSKPIRLTLGYNINELPENAISIVLAYYTVESGWVELEAEDGVVAELGRLTASVDHFTIFAVLASVPPPPLLLPPPPVPPPPAAFELSNLSIMPSFSKVWELLTFVVKTGEEVTITVDVTNYGGQEGNYGALLKINGVTQAGKEITLGAGQWQKIVFTVTENEPGSYVVEIGNLSGEFQSLSWFNWWLTGGLTAVLILLGWLAWYYWYYKKGRKTY